MAQKEQSPWDQFQPYLTWGIIGTGIFTALILILTLLASLFGIPISTSLF